MASSRQTYYRPYLPSDSELSDADTESDISESQSPPQSPRPDNAGPDLTAEGIPDYTAFAQALNAQTKEAAGPSLVTIQQEDTYAENRLDSRVSYSAYGMTDISGQQLKTTETTTPTVIMLQSRDRDKTVFTQPTNCKLFLPRIYKNITDFSIVQLNLTSAFFYFRKNKFNLEIEIQEENRPIFLTNSTSAPTKLNQPLKLIQTLREGSYSIVELLGELTTQLNATPLFYDFINGFSDFLSVFSVNGDYSLNFNEPGDNYYDAINKVYINLPTREIITSFYFQARYALQYTFTIQQVRNAYYYPVIKEAILDPDEDLSKYNFTYAGMTEKEVKTYLTYNFKGIDDEIATAIINANVVALDTYRLRHTFRYSLVNKYVCTYNTANNRVSITTPTLNTSLNNLLITQYNSYLDQQLTSRKITREAYNALSSDIVSDLSVIQKMYDYMQINFARYFAVNYGTYSREYFSNLNNTIVLRPGLDAKDIALSYTANVASFPRTTDIINEYKNVAPNFWPFMKNLPYSTIGAEINMGDSAKSYPASSNHPYILSASNMDISRDFVNENGQIYTDYRRKAGDVLVNVDAGKYTIFKFRSSVRQNLQIETLPRQDNFRYPIWNKVAYDANLVRYPVNEIFDISYSFIQPTGILRENIAAIPYKPLYGWSTITGIGQDGVFTNFGITSTTSANFWGNNFDQLNSTQPNGSYYRFVAPYPVDRETKGSNVYTYNFSIKIISTVPFPSQFLAYFYHDETAFLADKNYKGGRNENEYNYKHLLKIEAGAFEGTYTFKAYAGQNYYMIFRSSIANSSRVEFKVVPFFPDGNRFTPLELRYDSNFKPATDDPTTFLRNFNIAKNADPAFIRLPIQIPSTNYLETTAANQPLATFATPIGYDLSGVSTDLTDYIPFSPFNALSNILPSATFRIDPLTDYIFQYNSPYDLTKNSYFTSNTSNFLFTASAVDEYIPKTVLARQYKIAQYYATHYLRDTGAVIYDSNAISPNIKVYNKETTNGPLSGYRYDDANSSAIALGQGVCGFTFLPDDGVWSIDRITFKTNFVVPSAINDRVHCLAVFFTSDIYSEPVSGLRLDKALAICLRYRDKIYTPANQNLGFDAGLGTYHSFSNYPGLVTRTNFAISGFTQGPKQLITDVNSYYSAIAISFTDVTTWNTSNINISNVRNYISNIQYEVSYIQNMVGTPIPYPYAGSVSTSSVFYDGLKTPTGEDLVVSSPITPGNPFGPDSNLPIDESVSQYGLSMDIINSHVHYLVPQNIISDSKGFSAWSNLPVKPDYIYTSVIDNRTATSSNTSFSYSDGYALVQGTVFTIMKYKVFTSVIGSTPPDRNFTFIGQLTTQQIFPDYENTSLIGVNGTSSDFVFLGASNIPGQPYSQLRFKKYDPIQGVMIELPRISQYTFSNNFLLQKFVFNNNSNWFYTAAIANTNSIVLKGSTSYGSDLPIYNISYTYNSVTRSELQLDPKSTNLYLATFADPGFTTMSVFSIDIENRVPNYIGVNSVGYTINLDLSPLNVSSRYYTQFSVTFNRIEEMILANTDYDARQFFKLRNFQATNNVNTSNTNIDFSTQFLEDDSKNPVNIKRLLGGVNGSKWILADSPPYIFANRNDAMDAPTALALAWQIFFPVMKIEMRKLASGTTPILDRTSIRYPEWPHTVMFAYSNFTSMSNDILAEGGKWGLERNFLVSDVGFKGFDFNSYLENVPLQPNSGLSGGSNEYYYVAVRGYLPTESFQTMMRFYLPNRYDFGFVRLTDIAGEIPLAIASPSNFNPLYRETLRQFNSNFVFSNLNFGSNATQNIAGSNLNSSNFGDFLRQFSALYQSFESNSSALAAINSNVKNSINTFIDNNLQFILPPSALTRQRFTDPILSRILWFENLNPNYVGLDDEWGLGWNLGYAKSNTEYSTTHIGSSFFKIQQDYIYLRLNPEFNINGMDSGGKENYVTSREPSGTTRQYYCKLLLTSFGGNATTFIHNPIKFNPPINRMTNLQFQWVDSKGILIDNTDCEWDMTVNIREFSSVPQIPNKMDFAVADPKTGLPMALPAEFQAPKIQAQGDYAANKEKEELEGEKKALRDAALAAQAAQSIRTGRAAESVRNV